MQARCPARLSRIAVLCLLAGCLALTACGKKASMVDPPLGAEDSGFPHTYPDTSQDPHPTYNPNAPGPGPASWR